MKTLSIEDVRDLAEDVDVEIKRATGRDGRGSLPKSIFESYAAMANTDGGVILLGIEEKSPGNFEVLGIQDIGKVRKELWDGINDRSRVSTNLLADGDVTVMQIEGKNILRVSVPRARRTQRPVFLGNNPLSGTYRRNFEGDYRCDEETVRRMLAEQVEDIRDAKLLEHYSFDDLDASTFNAYRQSFKATKPDHPWLNEKPIEFLRLIGGWSQDRATGKSGLTLAGLLMFGKLRSILDVVPNYVVDYQERPEPKADGRWVDRITTDGTWSGNLYDFYRRVIQRLYSDLKVPFVLRGDSRIDDTPVHEALREALVNTLIHADYTGRVSILVVKRPDMFGFRNPGSMRLPLEDVQRGGTSDCRNRNLQKMFQLVGLGEQAGSGVPKIYRNWKEQHWRLPNITERYDPEQTLLEMRMMSLLPEVVVESLDRRFGAKFRELPEIERLALATVEIEGKVTHPRLMSMTTMHRHDVTTHLQNLVAQGFLESGGATRGTYYFFPGSPPEDGFASDQQASEPGSEPLDQRSGPLGERSGPFPANSEQSAKYGELWGTAEDVRKRGKAPKELVQQTILKLCSKRELTLKELSELLDRAPDFLRKRYVNPMVKSGELALHFPDALNHPNQAYRRK